MCTYRYDYENCDVGPAEQIMNNLQKSVDNQELVGKVYSQGGKDFKVSKNDNFEYTDSIDHSVSRKQVQNI